VINAAAGEYLTKLSLTGIEKDIVIAAEMAGLMMLRNSTADLSNVVSGMGILGAIPDETARTMNRFVFSWAMSNGLNPKDVDFAAIPAESKAYLKELTRFEAPLIAICKRHEIEPELRAYVAAAAAMKLVAAGKMLGLLEPKIGQAMVMFHVVAGSKTMPYPVD
jgi:hypothetical protein